jgi:hypothetical protein
MQYPFTPIPVDEGFRYFPLVIIEIIVPAKGSFFTKALVDSGAERSLFDAELIKAAGITNIQKYPRHEHYGAGGSVFEAWEFHVYARFQGIKFKLHTDWAYMRHPKTYQKIGFNLLGRQDFFQKFRVNFNERKKLMDIIPFRRR